MRVIGVDPGTFKLGVGIVDSLVSGLTSVHYCVVTPGRKDPLPQRLDHLCTQIEYLIEQWKPSEMAIEEPFASRNVRSALAIGQAQAVTMVAAARHGLPVSGYAPREVKQAVTDYGDSSKEQVQEMVRILLGLGSANFSLDASDALAVAICHVNASRVDEIVFRG